MAGDRRAGEEGDRLGRPSGEHERLSRLVGSGGIVRLGCRDLRQALGACGAVFGDFDFRASSPKFDGGRGRFLASERRQGRQGRVGSAGSQQQPRVQQTRRRVIAPGTDGARRPRYRALQFAALIPGERSLQTLLDVGRCGGEFGQHLRRATQIAPAGVACRQIDPTDGCGHSQARERRLRLLHPTDSGAEADVAFDRGGLRLRADERRQRQRRADAIALALADLRQGEACRRVRRVPIDPLLGGEELVGAELAAHPGAHRRRPGRRRGGGAAGAPRGDRQRQRGAAPPRPLPPWDSLLHGGRCRPCDRPPGGRGAARGRACTDRKRCRLFGAMRAVPSGFVLTNGLGAYRLSQVLFGCP